MKTVKPIDELKRFVAALSRIGNASLGWTASACLTKKCSGADVQLLACFGRFGCSDVCFAGDGLW